MKRIQYLNRSTVTLVASLCLALLLVGCGSSTNNSTANTANSSNANSNTTANTNSSAGRTSETPATASTGGEKIGVPACDEYIEKYEACLKDKVPAAGQAQLRASLDTMRNSWRTAAANPQTKAGLNQGCQAALNAAKQSMSAYGCAW